MSWIRGVPLPIAQVDGTVPAANRDATSHSLNRLWNGTAPEQRASGSSGVGLPAGRSQGGSDDDLFMGRQVSTLPNLPSANCHSVRSVPLRITQMDGTVPFRGRNPLLAKSTQPQKTMFLGFQTMKPCPAERDTLNTRPKTSCRSPAALNYIVKCFLSAQL